MPPPADSEWSAPVLIVDDDPAKRLALKAALAPLGCRVVEADSGLAALRCVMSEDFAVILLDVRMPVMDGFETAALIRERRQSEMTAIIFVTAYGKGEFNISERYAQGAVDFIYAPVSPSLLRAKVRIFARLHVRAAELAKQAKETASYADYLTGLTDAAPIGIFQTDANKSYVYTNPRWSEITGISAYKAVGRRWDDIMEMADRDRMNAELACNTGPWFSQRFKICDTGPGAAIGRITMKAVVNMDGAITSWIGTLSNVTLEAQAEKALKEARDEATAASQLKSDFLANMSHEIRTPMNGVIGMTDLLLDTNLTARQGDYVGTIAQSGRALLDIIDDILDFSKVEAGKVEIEEEEFDPVMIAESVVNLLAMSAQAKGVELMLVRETSLAANVRGDAGRLRQVLTNLIGNAIKFTQSGSIIVQTTTDEVQDRAVIRFEVTDTGDGIPAEKLEAIFEPFVQVDTSTSRKYEGTGLGLAISARLITLMGGECGVTSSLGQGSTFWFTIQVERVAGQEAHTSPRPNFAGVTALIVDDNAAHRTALSATMNTWDMEVTVADSGLSGLAALCAAAEVGRPFDIALLDRFMPEMDGLELAGVIAADPVLVATRLVIMSDLVQEHGHEAAADTGLPAVLAKPIHPEALQRSLRLTLGGPIAERASEAAGPPTESPSDEGGRGRVLLAEDNRINQKVAVAMLSSAGYHVDAVLNGAEAVQAVTERSYDVILMDCQMPELNGYDATARIRERQVGSTQTPIIAMTAGARPEDRKRCLAAGMDEYLAKPFRKDTLLALVDGYVNAGPRTEEDILESAIIEELAAFGEDYLAEFVDQFLRETASLLAELLVAHETHDPAAVARIAHSVKGSAGQIGGHRLARSCDELETRALSGSVALGEDDVHDVVQNYEQLCYALTRRSRSD